MLDFHAHSTASDGQFSPREVVKRAHARGVRRFALTDHDTVSGLAEAQLAAVDLGVELVPGVEISATWDGQSVHVLGYFFDPTHAGLAALLERLVFGREHRNRAILARLSALGIQIPEATLVAKDGGTVGRPHIAQAMLELGVVKTTAEAFDRFLAQGRPAHVERDIVSPEGAAKVLHEAGGVAVLAHPLVLGADPTQVDKSLARARAAGLDGVEVHYSGHSKGQAEMVGYFARRHGLLPSGGSDFHGEPWPIHPPIDLALGEALEARAQAHRNERPS